MSVDSFFWLDQVQPHDRDRVGSKAFYLAMLLQRGYGVVPGLVISSDVFQTFLSQLQWNDPTFADLPASSLYIDVDNPRQLQNAAQQIRQAIVATPFPDNWLLSLQQAMTQQEVWRTEAVILRPSFSLLPGLDPTLGSHTRGLLDAQICRPTSEAIARTLKRVWAELFRARSLLYWQRLGIQPQQVQFAVLMQPVVTAIAAGEATRSSSSFREIGRSSELELRAVWGLGHSMAQGVMPDIYRVDAAGTIHVDRVSRKSIAYGIAAATAATEPSPERVTGESEDCLQMQMLPLEQQTQPALTQPQIERLAHLCRQVALTLDMSVELEWTLAAASHSSDPAFAITQVIPYSRRASQSLSVSPAADSADGTTGKTAIDSAAETAVDRFKGIAAAPGTVTALVWNMSSASLSEMPPGCVLVAPMILPQWISHLPQVAGIVTQQGGATSHGAILARELGIPAVVGVTDAVQMLQTGDKVLVNGDRGEVLRILSGEPEASNGSENQVQPLAEHLLSLHTAGSIVHSIHAHTRLPLQATAKPQMPIPATRIMVSLSQTESIPQTATLPIDGVGLLRSELLWVQSLDDRSPEDWLQQDRSALVDRLAQQIQPFADALLPRPVFYRSLDLRAHELPLLAASSPAEANPMLGLRGTYRYQTHPAWFEVELAALRQVQQAGYDNLRLILPFVRTVEEFVFCRDRIAQANLHQSTFELWIMAEVPSMLLLLPAYIKAGVQGVAIGCNDLTQLLLGVDRDHPQLAAHFDMTHPAVMQAIEQIIQTCRSASVPCTICGHLPHRPDVIDRLVNWGITGVSVEPGEVEWMSQAIDRAERRLLLERMRG